jgi:hypothetical protein
VLDTPRGLDGILRLTARSASDLAWVKSPVATRSRVNGWQFSIFHLTQFLSRESTVSTMR